VFSINELLHTEKDTESAGHGGLGRKCKWKTYHAKYWKIYNFVYEIEELKQLPLESVL